MSYLKLENICKDYHSEAGTLRALNDVNFELKNEYSEIYTIKVAEGYFSISEDDVISGYFTGHMNYEDTEYKYESEVIVEGYIEDNVIYLKNLQKEHGYIDDLE